jgi:hypothetical protein
MQVDGALQRGSTRPRRRRLNVLLAIMAVVVIAAVVALLVWAAPLARSGAGAQDASPNKAVAGSAIIHDDAGNVHRKAGSAVIHDDAWNVHPD